MAASPRRDRAGEGGRAGRARRRWRGCPRARSRKASRGAPTLRGHPLDLAEQRDEVVRGDHGGGVVARPGRSRRRARPGPAGSATTSATSGSPSPASPNQAPTSRAAPALGVGQGDERVERRPARVAERARRGRASRTGGRRPCASTGSTARGHLGDGGVGRGDQRAGRRPSAAPAEVVVAAEDRQHLPAGARQRGGERRPGPARPDDADARHGPSGPSGQARGRPTRAHLALGARPAGRADEVGGEVGERGQHEAALPHAGVGHLRGRARRR